MESYIPISFLNDFIFCPRSIYFHQLYGRYNSDLYHDKPQTAGKITHNSIDKKNYSTRSNLLIGIEVYCQKYRLCGKIDIFDKSKGILYERKREVKKIYDGYVYQLYAHYFALNELGYKVRSIIIHDVIHNKNYPVALPEDNSEMLDKFEKLIDDINKFDLEKSKFNPSVNKCRNCIYSNLCDRSLC
jgi:CRISPR-associated protein Cas4